MEIILQSDGYRTSTSQSRRFLMIHRNDSVTERLKDLALLLELNLYCSGIVKLYLRKAQEFICKVIMKLKRKMCKYKILFISFFFITKIKMSFHQLFLHVFAINRYFSFIILLDFQSFLLIRVPFTRNLKSSLVNMKILIASFWAVFIILIESRIIPEMIEQVYKECQQSENASDDDLASVINGTLPETRAEKCLMACLWESYGIVSLHFLLNFIHLEFPNF